MKISGGQLYPRILHFTNHYICIAIDLNLINNNFNCIFKIWSNSTVGERIEYSRDKTLKRRKIERAVKDESHYNKNNFEFIEGFESRFESVNFNSI